MSGLIFTLDLATRTGWAKGRSGEKPSSGAFDLKTASESITIGKLCNRLCQRLLKHWDDEKPMIVVAEELMRLSGFALNKNSEENVKTQISLHAAAMMAADISGVRLVYAHPSTVSKHFVDHGGLKRAEKKAAFVKRAQLLGYIEKSNFDDNQADALAVWDYACAKYSRAIPAELHFFGEVKC